MAFLKKCQVSRTPIEEPGEFSCRFFLTKIASSIVQYSYFPWLGKRTSGMWIHAYLAPAGTHDQTFLIQLCGKKKNLTCVLH